MKSPHLCVAILLTSLAGCSRSEPVIGLRAPRGGTLAGLPDGLGSVEIVRREVSGQPAQIRLALYFLGPEGQPMSPGPVAVTFKPKDRGASPIGFQPTVETDPNQAGALESPPFGAGGDLSGDLSATIGGKVVKVAVNVR